MDDQRVAVVIKREWGVSYHPAHVSRLLRQQKLSVQKPIERATQRDEVKVQAWREETATALFAKPKRKAVPSCA